MPLREFFTLKSEVPHSSKMPEGDAPTKPISIKKSVNLNYDWKISNFNKKFDRLESPIFANGDYLEYRMKIEKKGSSTRPLSLSAQPHEPFSSVASSTDDDIIYCVKLFHIPGDSKEIQSHCKFQLLSTIPKNTITWDIHHQHTSGMTIDCFELKRQNVLNLCNGFLQDNSITLTCEIDAVVDISISYRLPKCTLLNDCEAIFKNQEFTDFTFCVSGKEFKVHKAILAARSPVFKAMFNHDMEESKTNRVELPDIDEEVFRELLRFVYTGNVRNLNEVAFDLLSLADLYGLENLKVLCVQELCLNIAVDNAAQVLVLANLYSLENLKTVAIGYIGSHAIDVSKTEGWNDLLRSHPDVFTEVLTDISVQLLQVFIS